MGCPSRLKKKDKIIIELESTMRSTINTVWQTVFPAEIKPKSGRPCIDNHSIGQISIDSEPRISVTWRSVSQKKKYTVWPHKLREGLGDVERMLKAMIKSLEKKHLNPWILDSLNPFSQLIGRISLIFNWSGKPPCPDGQYSPDKSLAKRAVKSC